jgi:hypothetical protein
VGKRPAAQCTCSFEATGGESGWTMGQLMQHFWGGSRHGTPWAGLGCRCPHSTMKSYAP